VLPEDTRVRTTDLQVFRKCHWKKFGVWRRQKKGRRNVTPASYGRREVTQRGGDKYGGGQNRTKRGKKDEGQAPSQLRWVNCLAIMSGASQERRK